MRAGGRALSLLGEPLSAAVLAALSEGPRPSERLREAVGSPPREDLRARLARLTKFGLLARRERGDAGGTVDYSLTPAGNELLRVAAILAAWLALRPQGAAALGSPEAAASIRVLVEAWETITTPDVASLEARGPALLAAGLLEESTANGERRLLPTPWLRRAVGPLSAGAAWERRHLPTRTAAIARADVESAFLLAVPLLHLRPEFSGTCRLAVELPGAAAELKPVGALVTVERGRIVECTSRLAGQAHGWALGSPKAWLLAVIEGDVSNLRIDGNESLATELVWGLHGALFGSSSDL